MADATTTNYGWTKPTTGLDVGSWGPIVNADLDAIDTDLKTVSDVANAALPKSGDTMTGPLNLLTETHAHVDLGSVTGAVTLDLSLANSFSLTCSGAVTLSLSNVPATGKLIPLLIEINGGSVGVTWFTGAKFPGGSGGSPILTSGKDLVSFSSRNGGTSWNVLGWQLNES